MGFDNARYDSAAAAVTVDLSGGEASAGEAAGDTFVRVEGVVGSAFGDRIYGDAGANVLQGRAGHDTIQGGAGNDHLYGGEGADSFTFRSITEGMDFIGDFSRGMGNDVLDIRQVLLGYGSMGSAIAAFVRFTGTSSAMMWVNPDGIGSDFVALAVLQNVANASTLLDDLVAQGNLLPM